MKKIFFVFLITSFLLTNCTPEKNTQEIEIPTVNNTPQISDNQEQMNTQNMGRTREDELIIKKVDAKTVEIIGPVKLIQKMTECEYRHWEGYGYTLDWGDGTTKNFEEDNCSTTHTYSVGGEFRIQASLWHPGPTDAPETDWKDEKKVQIEKQTALGAPRVEITQIKNPQDGTIYYYQEFPTIQWKTKNLDIPYILETQALDENSVRISTIQKQNIAFNNSGETRLSFGEFYDTQILTGAKKMYLKVRLLDTEGKEVFSTTSSALDMSGEYRPDGMIGQELHVGTSGNTVNLKKSIYHPDCYSYFIDWGDGGDGGIPEQNTDFFAKDRCALSSTQKNFSHTYEKSGNYTVIFKDNSYDPFHSAVQNAGFIKKEVTIQ